MSYRIYRFEVLRELYRQGSNVVYEARDTLNDVALKLFEWSPAPARVQQAAEDLQRLQAESNTAEAFTSGHRMYFAATDEQAARDLPVFQERGLFPGEWPATQHADPVFEQLTPSIQDSPQSVSQVPAPAPARFPLGIVIAILLGVIVIAIFIFWKSGPSSNSVTAIGGSEAIHGRATIDYFNVDPQTLVPGDSVTVSWKTSNAAEVWLKGLGPQRLLVQASGVRQFVISANAGVISLEAQSGDSSPPEIRTVQLKFRKE